MKAPRDQPPTPENKSMKYLGLNYHKPHADACVPSENLISPPVYQINPNHTGDLIPQGTN
jgi:hypothetical protein